VNPDAPRLAAPPMAPSRADAGDVESVPRPVQLRLGLERPVEPYTLSLLLAGLQVLTNAPGGRTGDVWAQLAACGIPVESYDSGSGVSFPVKHLALLAALPETTSVRVDEALTPLWEAIINPPEDDVPLTLERLPRGELALRWRSGNMPRFCEVRPETVPALLSCDIAFVAAPDAWMRLRECTRLPVQAGRARVNLDGYIEIVSSKPQLVEASALPGLFRLDDTHFGVALPYADAVDDAPGFSWDGQRPTVERGPRDLPTLPVALSTHASADLRALTDRLAATRAAAVVWDPGLGRRILTLAALEALEAWPALIVTAPAGVWMWQRHLQLLGRRGSLTSDSADARIVTYLDLSRGAAVGDPTAIVFDEPGVGEGATVAARDGCNRLRGILDAYRVAVCSTWPDDDAAAQIGIMGLLRPGEFRSDIPLAIRYPLRPGERASEHAAAYLTRRRVDDPGRDATEFRRSSVHVVTPTSAQTDGIARLSAELEGGSAPATVLAEMLSMVTVGTTHTTSPKMAAALELAGGAVRRGVRVAVVTRHHAVATMLPLLLSPAQVSVVDAAAGQRGVDDAAGSQVCVVRFETTLPSLHSFDEVIVVDYPWSTAVLDAAVGVPHAPGAGPAQVTVVHAAGTVDDRLAMLATARRERGGWDDPAPPSEDETWWLLAPRQSASQPSPP
jgi:hypothetical protein